MKSIHAANNKSINKTLSNFWGGNIIKTIPPGKKEIYFLIWGDQEETRLILTHYGSKCSSVNYVLNTAATTKIKTRFV